MDTFIVPSMERLEWIEVTMSHTKEFLIKTLFHQYNYSFMILY